MNKRSLLARYAVALLLTGMFAVPLHAAPYHARQSEYPEGRGGAFRYVAQDMLSLDQAVATVRKRVRGRILSAGQIRRDGRMLYRITVLTPKGVVRVVFVDPHTGELE